MMKSNVVDSNYFAKKSDLDAPAALESRSLRAPWIASIRQLGENHRRKMAKHLMSLNPHDRYLRFGYLCTDEQIERYIQSIDFHHDDVFGIYNRKLELIAMAHLAYSIDKSFEACAEFGVSVKEPARGRGYGAQLFERAMKHAQNKGVQMMFIHALSQNNAMISIARKAGAIVERDGPETNAYLRLPVPTLDSQLTEVFEEQMAQMDYQLKLQARNFWHFVRSMQKIVLDK